MTYAVFAFEQYYPSGGWSDFQCFRRYIDDAENIAIESCSDDAEYSQAVNLSNGKVVLELEFDRTNNNVLITRIGNKRRRKSVEDKIQECMTARKAQHKKARAKARAKHRREKKQKQKDFAETMAAFSSRARE